MFVQPASMLVPTFGSVQAHILFCSILSRLCPSTAGSSSSSCYTFFLMINMQGRDLYLGDFMKTVFNIGLLSDAY